MAQFKKLLSALLVLAMLTGMVPAGFAEELALSDDLAAEMSEIEPEELPAEELILPEIDEPEEEELIEIPEVEEDPEDEVIDLGDEPEDEEIPAEEVEIPAEDVEIPAEDVEIPAEDVEIPTEDEEVPAEEAEVPAEDEEIPVDEIVSPSKTAEAASFEQGPVVLKAGTALIRNDAEWAELLEDGVVYLYTDSMKVVYTLDGETLDESEIDADAEYEIADAETLEAMAAYEGSAVWEGVVLLPLALKIDAAQIEIDTDEYLTYEMAAYGIPGLGRELTASETRLKADQAKHGVGKAIAKLTKGEDYVDGVLLLSTNDEAYAQEAAASVGGTLVSVKNGLAVIETEADLEMVMAAVCDQYAKVPSFSLNNIYHLVDGVEDGGREWVNDENMDLNAIPVRGTWATMKGDDAFLQDPSSKAHYQLSSTLSSGYQYMHSMVDTWSAWQFSTGSGVVVGVVDSGVYSSHEDLSGQVEGKKTSVKTSSDDVQGHGTHVAGIIAAKHNNGKGGSGIAPDAKIYAYCAGESDGSLTTEAVVAAVNQARADGCWVINCSFGGAVYTQAEAIAFKDLIASGTAVLAAAGNDSGMVYQYPSGFPDVITVSSVDPSGMRAPYSTYGSSTISAPGSYILSTTKDGKYQSWNGTSMATPVATGVAALWYGYKGTRDLNGDGAVNAEDVRTLKKVLTASCTKVTGSSKGMGAGIVNAGNLFKNEISAPVISFSVKNSDGTVPSGARITLESSVRDDRVTYVYTLNGTTPSVSGSAVTNGKTYSGYIDADEDAVKAGKRTLKVLAINAQGKKSKVATFTYTLDNKSTSSVKISGPIYVAIGKSIQLTAAASPLSQAKPVWVIEHDGTGGASISSSGVLTVPKNAADGAQIRIRARINGVSSASYACYAKEPYSNLVIKDALNNEVTAKVTLAYSNAKPTLYFPVLVNGFVPNLSRFDVSVSAPNKATVEFYSYGVSVVPKEPCTVKITVKANDGSGLTKSFTLTAARGADTLSVKAPSQVIIGKSAAVSAVISPSNVSSKAVTWSVDSTSASYGIKVVKNKLVVPAAAPARTVTLTARTTDGTNLSATASVKTVYAGSAALKLTSSDPRVTAKDGKAVSAVLFTRAVGSSDFDASGTRDETKLTLSNSYSGPVTWTSSKPGVATVSEDGTIQAAAPGNTVITCAAADGSGLKASVSIKVVNPVTEFMISPDTSKMPQQYSTLRVGKSVTVKPYFSTAEYGTPTDKGVRYEYKVYKISRSYSSKVNSVLYGQTDISTLVGTSGVYVMDSVGSQVKLDSKGKLTVKAGFSGYMNTENYFYFVQIVAKAKDGSGATAKHLIWLDLPDTIVAPKKVELYYFSGGTPIYAGGYTVRTDIIEGKTGDTTFFDFGVFSKDGFAGSVIVESSNPAVASIVGGPSGISTNSGYRVYIRSGNYLYPDYRIWVMGNQKGTATVSVRFTDGSNKKISYKVKVIN